jgi:hypothetical protein
MRHPKDLVCFSHVDQQMVKTSESFYPGRWHSNMKRVAVWRTVGRDYRRESEQELVERFIWRC